MLHIELHPDRGGVPARSAQRAEMRGFGGLVIEMEGLRIKSGCKADNVLFGEGEGTIKLLGADFDVLVLGGHARPP